MATLENCKVWEKSGKNEFVKLCKKLFVNQELLFEGTENDDIKRTVYNLFWFGVRGQLKIEQVTAAIGEIVEFSAEIPSMIADVFAVIDVELMATEDAEHRERFINMITAFQHLIPDYLLKERLDAETLENIGLIQSKVVFQQKYVKTKTKIYYKQQKFNLLREESEGYSKLTTELNQDFSDDTITHSIILENIKSLIGCFNLDPNRVLDIILESFECRPTLTAIFVPLLRDYATDKDTLCHVLGFKFHFYQQTQDLVTPASLYHMAAILLQHHLVSLEVLFAHLSPSNVEIVELSKQEMIDAKLYARKTTVVNLADKAATTNVATIAAAAVQNGTAPAATVEAREDRDKTECRVVDNQKFGLCEALITLGAWDEAKRVLDCLPPYSALSCQSLSSRLCDLVSYIIEPLYVLHSGLPKLMLKKRPAVTIPATQNVTQAKTFHNLPVQAFPMLRHLGCNLASNQQLLVKVNRLAKSFMEKKDEAGFGDSTEVFAGFLSVYDEVVLPSLSLMPGNCCMTEEIWGFVKQLKYEHRYRLYGQWKNESYLTRPKLVRARADVLNRSKYIMKRLAKENVKPLGRQLGKLSHSGPGIIFEYILSQIQQYDNFIGPVVDSLKFLTSMAYDVLAYCVIEALGNPERERLKTDDTNISTWLQSLANFSGSVVKKYNVDIAGLLHYIANQLKAGKSYDLYVLREVIQKMAGIEISEEVTLDQLMAMSGGELLKQEAGYFTQVRNTRRSSSRLLETLLEHRLAIPMCLLMSQQRNGTLYIQPTAASSGHEDHRHLKLIGKLYDQCQDTVVQFVSFLSHQLSTDELVGHLPPINDLLTVYHIPADVSFALWRTVYEASINSKFEELKKADKKDKTSSSSQAAKRYIEAIDHVMLPVRQLIIPLNTLKNWDEFSVLFYSTFWSLAMYDLHVPSSSYEKQIVKHKSQQTNTDDSKDLAQSKKKKDKDRGSALVDKLIEEEMRQQEHVNLVLARLKHEKDSWFTGKMAKHSTITAIIQHCIFPRCCFTATDAIYCAKFLYVMHNLKTPNFSSLICYDRIFSDLSWSMTSCTENEAHRYGRFISAVLDDVMRWHGDKNVYEKECANYPGFVTVFRSLSTGNTNVHAEHLDYENYRHVVHKWHYSITKVAVLCLESTDYMQIRNMLIVLTKILSHYPKVFKLGQALERRIERVIEIEKDKRPDIYALALAYGGQLKLSRKGWILDNVFHKKEPDAAKPANAASTNSIAPVVNSLPAPTAVTVSASAIAPVANAVVRRDKEETRSAVVDKLTDKSPLVKGGVSTSASKIPSSSSRTRKDGESNGTAVRDSPNHSATMTPSSSLKPDTKERSAKDAITPTATVQPSVSRSRDRTGELRKGDGGGATGGSKDRKGGHVSHGSNSTDSLGDYERKKEDPERGGEKRGDRGESKHSGGDAKDSGVADDTEPSEGHVVVHTGSSSHHRRSNPEGSASTRADGSVRTSDDRELKRRKVDSSSKTLSLEAPRAEERGGERGNGVRLFDSKVPSESWGGADPDVVKSCEGGPRREKRRVSHDREDEETLLELKRYKSEEPTTSSSAKGVSKSTKANGGSEPRITDRKKARDAEKDARKEQGKERDDRPHSREEDGSRIRVKDEFDEVSFKPERTRVKVDALMSMTVQPREKAEDRVKVLKQEEEPRGMRGTKDDVADGSSSTKEKQRSVKLEVGGDVINHASAKRFSSRESPEKERRLSSDKTARLKKSKHDKR